LRSLCISELFKLNIIDIFGIIETLNTHPKDKEPVKTIAKALKVTFETYKSSSYNPDFVAKILAGEKAKNEGENGLRIDIENLWK
jgi:hypothetical protein